VVAMTHSKNCLMTPSTTIPPIGEEIAMTKPYSVREEQTWVSDNPKEVQAKLHEMIDKLYSIPREYYNISMYAAHTASTENEYYVRISGMYKEE